MTHFYRSEPNTRAELRRTVVAEFGDDGWEPDDVFMRQGWRAAQLAVTGPDTMLCSQPSSGTQSV